MPDNRGNECRFNYIGQIRSPYSTATTPYQPVESAKGEFRIELYPDMQAGLRGLDTFKYVYVLYHLNQVQQRRNLEVEPPWAKGKRIGLFASRSPSRPNPIGLSVVRIKKISKAIIWISGIDVYDKTPLLDIKPYIADLDNKVDANNGWADALEGREHLNMHLKGIPHDDQSHKNNIKR